MIPSNHATLIQLLRLDLRIMSFIHTVRRRDMGARRQGVKEEQRKGKEGKIGNMREGGRGMRVGRGC